ncbi:hypothetical protein [Paraliomyxa miuraensis]|uniref:hypothetical protein n=1 Tax=Paraliomyxa miuraensis TaxID=376150 RepID=UPI0022526031|nr:hypothetical protein [Paraliomyxa miuraensis]MCX4240254.1 hypothetical protein [Paraliomyxa miuraensis]
MAAPALEPHARRQALVVTVAEQTASEGYFCASEMLTRAGSGSDFATDACICREGIDPATGGRHLEELAFEVVAEQSLREITERAQDLASRGVRRVFAIFVKTNQVCEWSAVSDGWVELDPARSIEDPALVRPIPVRALLDPTAADDAVAAALLAKNNPVLAAREARVLRDGIEQGRAQASRVAIEGLCGLLGIVLEAKHRAQLEMLDAASLEALHAKVLGDRRWS